MPFITTYTTCPYCSAQWSMEEIEEQYCGACGYPNNDEDENHLPDEFDYPDYDDTDDVMRIEPGDFQYH